LKLVLSRGNAPRSLAYQASALLLSYERVLRTVTVPTVMTGARSSSDRAPSVFETSPESRWVWLSPGMPCEASMAHPSRC